MTISVGPRPVEPAAIRRGRRGREVWVSDAGAWLPADDPRALAELARTRPVNPPGPIVRRQVEPEVATAPADGVGSGYRLTATQAHEHRVRGGQAAAAKRVARSRPQAPDHPFRRPFSQGTQPKEDPMPVTAPPETPSGRTPPPWKVERACEEDGTLFMPRDRHQVLCSRDCSRARAARMRREQAEATRKAAAAQASEPERAPEPEPRVGPLAASSDGQVAAPDDPGASEPPATAEVAHRQPWPDPAAVARAVAAGDEPTVAALTLREALTVALGEAEWDLERMGRETARLTQVVGYLREKLEPLEAVEV